MNNPLINISDVIKPVDTMIEKIANAIGVLYEPTRIKRTALANAEANRIMFLSNLDLEEETDRRAIQRLVYEERSKLENIENVIEMSIELILCSAKPEEVETDWLSFFFDKVKLTSDEQAKQMWGRLLAAEVNEPHTISRSLIHCLSIMSKTDLQDFHNITRFCFIEKDNKHYVHPAIFIMKNKEAYYNSRIDTTIIMKLSRLGLLEYNWNEEFVFFNKSKSFTFGNRKIEIISDFTKNGIIEFGNVRFTEDGIKLYEVAEKIYNYEILDFTIRKLKNKGYIIHLNENLF